MKSVFAPEDVAALISRFPPPLPTKDKPSLVRARSNHATLRKSDEVLRRLQNMLKTSSNRIPVKDLPLQLDIEQVDWIWGCFQGIAVHSRDGQSIIPEPEQEKIKKKVLQDASTQPLSLRDMTRSYDLTPTSLELLLVQWQSERTNDLANFDKEDDDPYVYTNGFRSKLKSRVETTLLEIDKTQRAKIDLDVPPSLLQDVVQSVLHDSRYLEGRMEVSGDEIYYIPLGFEEAQQQKATAAYEKLVDRLVQFLRSQGYCSIPTQAEIAELSMSQSRQHLLADVIANNHAGDDLVTFESQIALSDGRVEIWRTEAFQREIGRVIATAKGSIDAWWKSRDSSKTEAAAKSSFKESVLYDHAEWASILSGTEFGAELDNNITEIFSQMEQKDTEAFQMHVKTDLRAITDLYLSGIQTIIDPTLKHHLEEFVTDHLRREVLPPVIDALRTQNLLHNKTRARDVDKCQRAIAEAKSPADVRDAIHKLARKHKLPGTLLSAPDLRRAKLRFLRRRTLPALGALTRGSDLLQNLLWILLAEQSVAYGRGEALFVSSGKDTSRMIRQYRAVAGGADAETVGRVERWRDMLKNGEEDAGEMEAMRRLAGWRLRVMVEGSEDEDEESWRT